MVCSAWNPNQIDQMALPPCHYAWNVTVIGDEINLFWAQRSCDLMLGVPVNISSYATLLMLLAKESGFKPGNLSGMLVDCHIYSNQIEPAKMQIQRKPSKLPELEILNKEDGSFSVFDWCHTDVKLTNYNPQDKIDFGDVTV
jgi:thymidylate synthase